MSGRKKWKVMLDPDFLRKHALRGNELRLYLLMMSYKRAHLTCWPSRSTLAKDLGISVRSVDRCKAALEKKGLVSWAHKKVGERLVDEYVLGENIPVKSRFNFSTSLVSITGDEGVSPQETEVSPYRRRKCPPNKTNGKRRNEENEGKRIFDRCDDVEATSSLAIEGVEDTRMMEKVDTQLNPINSEAHICSTNLDSSCSANLDRSFSMILEPIGCLALEFEDEGENDADEKGEAIGYPALEFDDDKQENDRDDERDIWAAYPFEIEALLPIYQAAHIQVFGVPYRLREEVEPLYYEILRGKLDHDRYMSYRLDSKDVPFVRDNMEGIITYAATPVPDKYRWLVKDYSPSVIFNESLMYRFRELLALEALPPFSIHHGLMKRTPRRTRRQERIWQWLTNHKDLPIWKYLRKGGSA
jgi:Helix-turn-helix domain